MSERPKGEGSADTEVASTGSSVSAARTGDLPAPGNGQASDQDPEPATLSLALKMLADLRSERADLEVKLRDAEDRHLRDRAELENFKRRSQRERSEALRYACEGLLRDLLPVVDNLERALRAAAESSGEGANGSGATAALVAGVELVQRQLLDALERHGVTRIDARGQPFEPALHEAVFRVESDQAAPGTVVDELAPGYRLHDRLLRAAQVSVAQPPRREN
jgi:molecular chaperone GrpE